MDDPPKQTGVGVVASFDFRQDRELWPWVPDEVTLFIARTDVVDTSDPAELVVAERELGKPIVTANQATIWAALRENPARARQRTAARRREPGRAQTRPEPDGTTASRRRNPTRAQRTRSSPPPPPIQSHPQRRRRLVKPPTTLPNGPQRFDKAAPAL
jgi:hypothetical protein